MSEAVYLHYSSKMQCHGGHPSLGHSGAPQEPVPGALRSLLGGEAVVRAAGLNILPGKGLVNQTVFSLRVFIIVTFQTPEVQFIF